MDAVGKKNWRHCCAVARRSIMRRLGKISVILSAVIFASAAVSSCGKKDNISEIDRTFEFSQPEIETTSQEKATQQQTESTTQTESGTKETTTKETTTRATEEETTKKQLTGAAVYFEDEKSVFGTLPVFEAGKYEEHFDQGYVEGMRFSGTEQKDYEAYLQSVLNEGKYTLNSQDGTRAYLAAASGKMCITLIYKDGTMLIEAGESYWDILTYAEEPAQEQTKPSETADGRYAYFDNEESVFSQLPYLTEGSFTGYEAVDGGGIMTFTSVSEAAVTAYGELLENSGFMFASTTPDGLTSYYVSDSLVVTCTYQESTVMLKVVKQQ